ncbi:alginate lyase family protein [Pedobacter soli]|uniref:Alginate lyase n=1 Tax=Pedobacter soli TaxID=390242 RepID=A0A1G6ZFA8_9SPHI|nr:alginate lyase family protein [Pedobacter soli]SDE01364.1 Alginate lyase [Pedobacter soli]
MNKLKRKLILYTVLCLIFWLGYQNKIYASDQPGGMHPQRQIDFVKAQIRNKKEPYFTAFKALIIKADSGLLINQHAVEDFSIPGFYADKEGHRRTSLALQVDGFSAYSCALAYQLTGQAKYALKAIYFLNSWAATNKKYSQLDGSLVMSYSGTTMMMAAELLKNNKSWKAKDQQQFIWWTKNVFRQAANSIRYRNNNSGDWSRFASLLADVYLNDQEDFQKNVEMIKNELFKQIAPDGHMVEEVKRQGNGIWYTYFSLAPISASFWVVYNQTSENLFSLEQNGTSLKKALDYLLYHNQHPEEWTWFKKPVTGNKDTATGFWPANLLEALNGIYHSKDFDDFVAPYRPIVYPRHDYAWTYPTLFPLSLTQYR